MRLLIALAALVALATPSRAQPADVALVLAVDVSGSVTLEEYQTQTEGIAAAFESEEMWRAVSGSAIAVAVLQWSGPTEQKATLPWRRIETRADMLAVAKDVKWMRREFNGSTDVGSALEASGELLDSCPWPALRRVIDVSGDGPSNAGPEPADVRDRLAARGIQINGLAIDPEETGLTDYYRERVIGGPGGFLHTAKGFKDFARAILAKLIVEIALHPSPSIVANR